MATCPPQLLPAHSVPDSGIPVFEDVEGSGTRREVRGCGQLTATPNVNEGRPWYYWDAY